MSGNTKEVNFNKYCNCCQYRDLDETQDPCDDCLATPMNTDSRKPINWKEEGQ